MLNQKKHAIQNLNGEDIIIGGDGFKRIGS